jgi:glycosyltransferase involved in cell wall biosynthesis
VLIPCYQAEKYVGEAIDSAVTQSYENVEVIAINDGSTDQTISILNEYAGLITILQHPGGVNRGVSLSRKLGIDHAGGKYIAFLDADDYFEPEKIEKQVGYLESNPNVVLCHTAINVIGDQLNDGDLKWFNFRDEIYEYELKVAPHYLRANWICNSSVMIRAEVMRKIPFAGNQLFQFEDWLAWNLAAEYGSFVFLPSITANYRFHPLSATNSIFNNKLKSLYSYFEFYLSLASQSRSVETKTKCMALLLEKIEDAYCEYGRQNPSKGDNENRDEFRKALAKCVWEKNIRISTLVSKTLSMLKR